MDEIDRKILVGLTTKETIAMGALCHIINVRGEDVEVHISEDSYLREHDLLRVIQPVQNPIFLSITEKGRRALWKPKKRMLIYLSEHWVDISTLILSGAIFLITLISLLRGK